MLILPYAERDSKSIWKPTKSNALVSIQKSQGFTTGLKSGWPFGFQSDSEAQKYNDFMIISYHNMISKEALLDLSYR